MGKGSSPITDHVDGILEIVCGLDELIFEFLFFFKPVACGSFRARGQNRAAAAVLCHSLSNTGSEPCL